MLLLLPFLLAQVPVDKLDALAQSRDVAGLSQYLADPNVVSPFKILKTGGGYAAGSKGWHAKLLEPKDGAAKYVVFSTPILAEDAGELLFRINSSDKLEYVPERDSLGVRLDSHTFDVSFDLGEHKVFVTDQFRFAWTTAPKQHFVFRLSPTFQVASITDAKSKAVPFVQAGGIVAVSPSGKEQALTVVYSGPVDKPGFAHGIGPDEATLSGTIWYPMIARRPTTYDITIHCQKNWLALAQGSEVSDTIVGLERVAKYHMDLPVVWISASAGPYRRVTTRINGRDYSTMSASASDEAMRAQNENNAEVIEFYSKSFGEYPFKTWTTLDSTQFRQGVGALEAYSFATYPASRVPFLDSHEPAHTWWGGIINNDYIASIWNESFADASQVIFNRDRPIGNIAERQKAFVSPGQYSPLFDAAPMAHSGQEIGPPATALGYSKGAFVLEVLEDELGTPTFLKSLHEWIRSNPRAHIGSWEDFETVVDKVSGKDYTWFFDEWARRPGFPNCSMTGGWSNGKFNGQVTFVGDPYRFDTDAVVEYPDGKRTFTRVSIEPSKDGRFTIGCPKKPAIVALDAWSTFSRKNMPQPPASAIRRFRMNETFVDPKTPGYMKPMISGETITTLPTDLDGAFIVGNPNSLPALKPLCEKVGFRVSGDKLTFKGTTIDLNTSGALAVVDLPEGKHCLIGLGVISGRHPDTGRARLVVLDSKGRVIRADTDPVETGSLAVRL